MNGFYKKTAIFLVVILTVAAAGWFGRRTYKKVTESRLISQAKQSLEKQDFQTTALCLQRAMQINPLNVESGIIMGDMLEGLGSPAAISWRVRVAQLQPTNVTNRFAWAQTAIKLKDYRSAAEALSGVEEKFKTTATHHKLLGALAWAVGRSGEAEEHYTAALRQEPTNESTALNLAMIHLTSTNSETATHARQSLEQMRTNAALGSASLHHLLTDAVAHESLPKAVGLSEEIIKAPSATFGDKIVHLQLLRQTKSPNYEPWLAALNEDARRAPQEAFALGRWMVSVDGPTNGLRWLQNLPVQVRTNQPVPLIITDCLVAVKDWKGLLVEIQSSNWGETEFYRLALQSLAERSLGRDMAAENSWRKSFRLADKRLDRLARLAEITSIWSWPAEQATVLLRIVNDFPKEGWALDQLAGQLYVAGKTRELQELFAKVYSTDPSNTKLKNNLANLFMLRKANLDQAYALAGQAYNTSTNNPFYASTYAYALLLQGKPEQALKIINGLKPEYLQIPQVAVYYGIIQAKTGDKTLARAPLKTAETSNLLPEEREIVRLAAASIPPG